MEKSLFWFLVPPLSCLSRLERDETGGIPKRDFDSSSLFSSFLAQFPWEIWGRQTGGGMCTYVVRVSLVPQRGKKGCFFFYFARLLPWHSSCIQVKEKQEDEWCAFAQYTSTWCQEKKERNPFLPVFRRCKRIPSILPKKHTTNLLERECHGFCDERTKTKSRPSFLFLNVF